MTIIPLGRVSPRASSHLPADSVGHVNVCLFGVAPRRDWPFHPSSIARAGIVTVPLILTSRWTGVTRYAALRSPDFPLRNVSGAAIAWLASPLYVTPRGGISRLRLRAEVLRVVVERLVLRREVPSRDTQHRHRRHRLGR